MDTQFFKIQDPGTDMPWAVAAIPASGGLPLAWSPEVGWFAYGGLIPYFAGGESGAVPITADEAAALVNAGVAPGLYGEEVEAAKANPVPPEYLPEDLPEPSASTHHQEDD